MARKERDDDFNEASYVRVNERLQKFREEHKEGRIKTRRHAEEGGIYFECEILRNPTDAEVYASTKIAAATGHAYLADEDRSSAKVEEYCETVAIGRALACLGYGVEKSIASAEEMEQYERVHGDGESEENEEEEEEKPKRRRRKAASQSTESSEDSEEEPKLRSSRKIKRGSKLSKRTRRKGD